MEDNHAFMWTPYVLQVVERVDPELADMDNPKGEIYADMWHPCLEDANGSRILSAGLNDHEDCVRECRRRNQEKVGPSPDDIPTYPAYLSKSYRFDLDFVAPTDNDLWENF